MFKAEEREKDLSAGFNFILEKWETVEGFKAVEWLSQTHVFKNNSEIRV